MTSGRRRAGIGAALAAALITLPALAACEAGQQAETRLEHFGDGANVMTPDRTLMLSNVYLVPPDNQDKIHGTAFLYVTVTNLEMTGERLLSVTSPGRQISVNVASPSAPLPGSETFSPSPGSASRSAPLPSPAPGKPLPLDIPAGGGVALGPYTGNPVTVSGLPDLFPGQLVDLTFHFANAGPLTATTPVNAAVGPLAVFTSVSASKVTAPPETVDPSFLQQPYDDVGTTIQPTGPQPEPPVPSKP